MRTGIQQVVLPADDGTLDVRIEGIGSVFSIYTDLDNDGSILVTVIDDLNDCIIHQNTLERS